MLAPYVTRLSVDEVLIMSENDAKFCPWKCFVHPPIACCHRDVKNETLGENRQVQSNLIQSGPKDSSLSQVEDKLMAVNNRSKLVSSGRVTVEENTSYVTGTMVVADEDGMDNGSYEIYTDATYGQVSMNKDGEWVYIPKQDWIGWDKFLVLVKDDLGNISTHYMHVFVLPTTANHDQTQTENTTAIRIDVLANDQITGANKIVTHINGQIATVGEAIAVANGYATLLEDGQIEFAPLEGYTGQASFKYTAQSDTRLPSTATVSIVVTDPNQELPAVQIDGLGQLNSVYPLLSGTTQVGTDVAVRVTNHLGEVVIEGNAVVNQDGSWTFADPSVMLADGAYQVSAIASNASGLLSEVSRVDFVVDVTAPTSLVAELSNDTGLDAKDQMTIDGKVKVTGIEEGATWWYSLDNGQTWTQGLGSSFIVPEGTYAVQVKQIDTAGNVQVEDLGTVTVDTTPVNVSIHSMGAATNSTPQLSGTTDAGNRVTVEVRTEEGELVTGGLATVNGNTWHFDVPVELADTLYYSVVVVAENPIGATQHAKLTILIDASAPQGLNAALIHDTGVDGDDQITQVGEVKVTGIEAGASWSYSLDEGVTWIQGEGVRFTLAPGLHEVVLVRQVDAAGLQEVLNIGPITVDQSTQLNILGVYADEGSRQGHVHEGQISDDTTPTLYGEAEPGSQIKIYLNEVLMGEATVAADGHWVYTLNQAQPQGDHVFKVELTDVAGNTAQDSFGFKIVESNAHSPDVYLKSGALLGLVEADLLGIITLENRPLAVFDQDNDLTEVILTSKSLLGLSGEWDYSTVVADALGLQVTPSSTSGLLGLVGTSSTLTITAADGGNIDNLKILEFLATVYQPNLLSVAGSIQLTAKDRLGNSKTAALDSLLDLGLLGVAPQVLDHAQVYDQTLAANSVRLYGDQTADTLIGSGYDDILRGGAGNDVIDAGAGDDYIVGGLGNDTITAGLGADTVVFELLDAHDATGGNGVDTWTDFNLSAGDRIDVSALFSQPLSAWTLEQYIQLEHDAAAQTVTVKVDRDGGLENANLYQPTDLLVLTNQSTALTLQQLLENHQILF